MSVGKGTPVSSQMIWMEQRIAELEAKVAGSNESLDKYRNGYQGSCWCCESVGMRNVELNTALERAREQMIDQAERAGKAEAAIERVKGLLNELNYNDFGPEPFSWIDPDELQAALKVAGD